MFSTNKPYKMYYGGNMVRWWYRRLIRFYHSITVGFCFVNPGITNVTYILYLVYANVFTVVNKSANERKKGTHAPATPPTPDRAKPPKTNPKEEKNIQQRATAAQADVQERAGKIRPSSGATGFIWAQKRRGYIGPSPQCVKSLIYWV